MGHMFTGQLRYAFTLLSAIAKYSLVMWRSWTKVAFIKCEFQFPNMFECECRFIGLYFYLFYYFLCTGNKHKLHCATDCICAQTSTVFYCYIYEISQTRFLSTHSHSTERCLMHMTNLESAENILKFEHCRTRTSSHHIRQPAQHT